MSTIPKLKFVAVFFCAFLTVVAFALVTFVLLRPQLLESELAGFGFFLIVLGFTFLSLRFFATQFLFETNDKADLQRLGGVRFGSIFQTILTGKGASWPFAKLSASKEFVRIQTPHGNFNWKTNELGPIERCGLLPGSWKFENKNLSDPKTFTFMVAPWLARKVETELKKLGCTLK